MRNISVFGTLCMICTCCLASPSLRASSIPLNHQPTMVAPKGTTTTTTTTSDSTNNVPVTTTTTDATTTNDARISFTSPLKQNSRYYVPTGTSAGTGSSSSGGGTTTNPTVTADIAAIQQQIDNLLDAQQQMADSVRTTVQNEIKNSDLTKNASFTDAVSTIQESAASMDQVNAAINEKVNDTLVEKGIVNNRGQLLVATTEEIQPLALSQKLDSTLSTKFAKKSDVTPTKIVADIATNQNAVQTLAQYIGTNEDTVKTLIASDLKQRGIITPNNTLNVATKSELPVINSETVTQALQTSGTIDNMISQNLITRGLYNSDNQLQVLKKSELTPELLTTKLGNTYATTSDISTENLSNKLNGVFVTPTALRDKNYATKSEIPVINEATVSAALANSSTLDNTVIANLKRKNILDANENLNVATKAELQTSELQQQINNIRTTQTNMAQNQLTRDDIASTVQTMDLTTANTNLSNALDAIRTSTQALQTSVTAVQNKANNISENLDSNIDSRLRDRGLMDSNGKINANALPSDVITSTDLADYAKTADILENGVVKSSKLPTTLVTKDPNGKISSAVLPSNVITANDLNGYAKTSDIMEAGTVKANLLPDNLVTKNSSGKIDSNVLPSGLVTSGDLADYAKTSDILEEGKLKVAKLPDTVVKTDVNGKIDSNVLPTGLLTSNDLADYAKTSDILENGVVKATKLPDTLVTKDSNGKIDTNVLPTGLLTSNDLADYAKTSDILENGVVKSSKLPDTLVTKDINGKIDSNVLPTGLLTSNDLADYAKTSDILEEGKLKVAKLPDAVVKTDVNGKIDSNVLPTDVITTTDLTDYAKTSDILENGVVKATKLPDTLVTKDSNGKIDSNVLPATVVTSSNKDDLLSDYVQTSVLSGYATTQAMQEAINNVSVAGGGSYSIKGSVATYSDLADTTTNPKSQGTGYIVNADGMLYVCSGTSSNASECTYPSQGNGISVRGEKGASFNFTGNCNWSSTIPGCNNSQEGNACAHTDGKLYICSCTGSNCEYKGTQLKGTDGVSPKSLEQQYCEDNFAIVQQLYPNNGLSSTTDCADTSKFSNANYTAIMGGAKAYCLSLARDPSSLGDLSSGIGKRLSDKLGSKMTDFISVNKSPAERLALTGFKTSKTNTSATGNFMTACEARYDEIMAGADGTSAKPIEQQYCEDNFAIVQQLYPNNGLSSTTDCADTSKFSNANYTAIMGGAKAYCLSLARDPSSLGDLSSGIGKRLSDKLGSKMTDFISVNKSPAERLALTGFKTSKTNTSATGNFMTACEARYDEIMAGADGADGISGDSAAETWCKAHSAQYTDKQTNQVVAITSPTALSASKGLSVFNVFKNKKSLTDNQIATKINTTTRIFASVEDCLAAVAEDPDIMTGKSAADSEFDKTNSELVLNSTNLADLNTFRSTGFKNTLKGKDGTGYTLKGSVNAYSDLPSTGNTKGDGWYVKANGLLYVYACESGDTNCAYPALADGVPIKGDPGENGLTYIPEINNGMLKWKNPEGTYYNLAEVKVRGDDGITYEPSVSDAGILTWKNKATGVTVEALGSKNIKGPQGNPGTNGSNGKTYQPSVASDGTLSWTVLNDGTAPSVNAVNIKGPAGSNGKTYQPSVASDGTLSWTVLNDGTAPSVNSINIKGPQGNPGTNGSNGKTYQPSVAADGTLSWTVLNDGTAPSVNSINIKGPAGENGVTFTPAFNSTTGNLSWTSSKAGVTAPEPVKIAKTDSELQTLVDGRITADTTLARQTDIQNFLTGNDLTPTFLAGKLGNTYLKDSDLTASVLEGKLGSTYTKTSDVNGLILADLQGRGIVSTGDNPQSLFATKAEIAPAELATSLGNTFAAKSSFDTLSGTVGGLTTTVNKLDGPATTSGSIAYQLANSGFAKTSDILENGVLKSDKVPGNLVTSTSLSNTLSGYTTASDFTALSNNAVTPDNIVNTFKQKFTGNASTGDAYSTATSLENLIKAIAADVARDVSVQVSEHVAKQVSSQVSDRVAKRRINEISDSLITPTKLTNFITNGIQTDDNGTVSLKTTNGGTCSAEPVFGKSGNTGSSTCGTGGSALAVNLSTSEALFDNVPASNTDGITADLTGLNISLPSYFTTVSCSTNQYVNTDTNQCAACPTGSTSNGGTVTSCTCSSNYYKSGNTCLPCGTGATSGGGNTTSCSCTATGTVWSSGANGGSCAYNQTACLNAPGTYWDNDTCKTLPAHSSRTSSGTGFECNAGYYWNSTQSKCLYCGNNATSEQGATSCTCKSGTWSPTSSGGTCAAQSETCSAIQIENKCLNTVETCNMYNQLGLTWMDKYGCQCTDNRYFNTHDKTCVACPTGQGAIIDETTHLCSCPAGQVLNTYQGRCVACEGDGITYKDGACTCTNGGTLDFTGAQLKCTA